MNKYKIFTSRTLLRFIQDTDLELIHQLHRFPQTDEFNTLGIPENIEETKGIMIPWIRDMQLPEIKNYTFAIESKAQHEFIGLFGFKLGNKKYQRGEVWYKMHPDQWGKGYATEVLKAVIDFGFNTLNLHRIEAGCAVDNIGSIKVLEKAGMLREGRCRQILPLKSGWSDNFQYAILKSDLLK